MFIDCKSSSIRYTGRFAPLNNTMTATANGSYFELAFSGKNALLKFDLMGQKYPYPHLWIQVDNGAFVETPLDWHIRIMSVDNGTHIVKVILKSSVEMQERWNTPMSSKVSFVGADVDGTAELPQDLRKTIELVGDSITEGVLIDPELCPIEPETDCRIYQDDVCATYAYLTAEGLNLRPYHVAYGAVGFTRSGNGAVPAVKDSYGYCFDGAEVTYPHPDYILINHGTNDKYGDVGKYISEYKNFLEHLITVHPDSKIIVLTGFSGVFPKETKQMVSEFNNTHNTDIFFIDSTGWVEPEPIHPIRRDHKIIAEHLIKILKDKYFK